jgi:hypothetical protein
VPAQAAQQCRAQQHVPQDERRGAPEPDPVEGLQATREQFQREGQQHAEQQQEQHRGGRAQVGEQEAARAGAGVVHVREFRAGAAVRVMALRTVETRYSLARIRRPRSSPPQAGPANTSHRAAGATGAA